MLFGRTPVLPTPEQALQGRSKPAFTVPDRHTVLGTPLLGPYPEGYQVADFGLGCFWGAERKFWQLPVGVWTTLVGYQGGHTENPTYEESPSARSTSSLCRSRQVAVSLLPHSFER
jgi:peptide-methionine (S)-S-oxide reductase